MARTARGSTPGRRKRFLSTQNLLFYFYRGSFSGIKQQDHNVDHSPPPLAEVKNEWSYTSTPPPLPLYAFIRQENLYFLLNILL